MQETQIQEKKKNKLNLFGIFVFIGKILTKIAGLKILWAAASFLAYSYLFSWQFALLIIGSVFFHELGHIWAAKRCGMPVKGIYLIPFVGGVALINGEFKSQKDAMFVSIMGPVWGFALALAMACLYLIIRQPLIAGAASWIALINLFNLLPIYPLDGGRIITSIGFSIHSRLGLVLLGIGTLLCLVLVILAHIWLFLLLFAIGLAETINEYKKRQRIPEMSPLQTTISSISFIALGLTLFFVMIYMGSEPGAALALKLIQE